MADYQLTTIIGRLTADPELRYSPQGTAICNFTVAVNESWEDRASGEKREKATFYRVAAWRALGENCNTYLRKGQQVFVTGKVEASAYLAQDGSARAGLELNARDVVFLGGKRDDAPSNEETEALPF